MAYAKRTGAFDPIRAREGDLRTNIVHPRLARGLAAPGDGGRSLAGRRILLLQGPVGAFFAHLRDALVREGASAEQIVFNAADRMFAKRHRLRGTVTSYGGREESFRDFLGARMRNVRPHAVVLFGCERDRHRIAVQLCHELDIPVLSLEEGYVRSGYVTAEWGGNNRASPLATATCAELKAALSLPVPQGLGGGTGSFRAMAWTSSLYYVMRSVGAPFYPYAVHHKDRPLFSETRSWIRSAWRKWRFDERNKDTIATLLEHHRDEYVLVPLQVSDDMQLTKSARGWSNERLIAEATRSFAEHAPAHMQLVFKIHPLERGHSDARARIAAAAELHGVRARVHALDDGSIGMLTRSACAMLTINSTSAFSAMFVGIWLGVLGDALFRRSEMAHCIEDEAALDRFWRDVLRRDPPRGAMRTLREAAVRTALVPGDFYRLDARARTVQGIVARIHDRLWAGHAQEDPDGAAAPVGIDAAPGQ